MPVQLHQTVDQAADPLPGGLTRPPASVSLPIGAWTDDKIDWLKTLWPTTVTTPAMGVMLGLNKNQIISRARSLGLGVKPNARGYERKEALKRGETPPPTYAERRRAEAQASAEQREMERQVRRRIDDRKAATKPRLRLVSNNAAPVTRPPEPSRYKEALNATCTDLDKLGRDMCKWPIGDPLVDGFGYCGRHRVAARDIPYCHHHAGVAYKTDD